jgi:hypothetical protein
MILPALTEATSPYFRPIKYSLFPPLGLATLAGYLRPDDEVDLQDEHVEALRVDDEPDLVVIQVYITSALRAYRLADHYRRKGAYVALGGLHVTHAGRLRTHGELGDRSRDRDGHLPHLAALPRYGALPENGVRGTDPPPELGPVRHTARRVSHAEGPGRRSRGRLLAGVS